jgi:hypothetical protein
MGIKNLTKLIADEAPGAIRERTLKSFNGRTIAIDASMALYQFMVRVSRVASFFLDVSRSQFGDLVMVAHPWC